MVLKLRLLSPLDRPEGWHEPEVTMLVLTGERQKAQPEWVSEVLFLWLTLGPWIVFFSIFFWGPLR